MEQQTQFPPIETRPLRIRGIFGVAWQLMRRGIGSLMGFTALLMLLPTAILTLPQALTATSVMQDPGNIPANIGLMAGGGFLFFILWLLYMFLIAPAYEGGLYLEMEQRSKGCRGTFGQLIKHAAPAGLKRIYSTYWALMLVALGIGIATYLIMLVLMLVVGISTAMPLILGQGTPDVLQMLPAIILVVLFTLAVSIIAQIFTMLIYPVAVHENRRAFNAIGRAFSLAARNFKRLLSATALLCAIELGFALVLGLVVYLLGRVSSGGTFVGILPVIIWLPVMLLGAPYMAAFNTALYIDSAARAQPEGQENTPAPGNGNELNTATEQPPQTDSTDYSNPEQG